MKKQRRMTPFYAFWRALATPIVMALFWYKSRGKENIPAGNVTARYITV